MIGREMKMYDVFNYKPKYDWAINPVAQLVKYDSRIKDPVTGRFCSGFNIDSDGMFLTAGHCLTEGDTCSSLTHGELSGYRISFNYQRENMYRMESESIYSINALLDYGSCVETWGGVESTDYAVLQLDKAANKFGYLAPVINVPSVDSDVVEVSHPNGNPKKISFGKVLSTSENKNNVFINHSAPIEPGSSGSPLCAVVTGTTTTGTTIRVAAALGINIRAHMAEDNTVDHDKNHISVSMGTVAKKSTQVRKVSFFQDADGSIKSVAAAEAAGGVNINRPSPTGGGGQCC